MKIYNYNPLNGELISEGQARPDPLEPGRFLIPANATIIEPSSEEGKVSCFINGEWINKEEIRGKKYWDKETGLSIEVGDLDFIASEALTDVPRPSENHKWANDSWVYVEPEKPTLSGEVLGKKIRSLFKGQTIKERARILKPVLTELNILEKDEEITQIEYDEFKTELILGIGNTLTIEQISLVEATLDAFVLAYRL